MLLVLACLLIVTVVCTGLAATAATARATREIDRSEAFADDLRDAAEAAIENWLQTKAKMAFVPPDALSPEIILFERSFGDAGGQEALLFLSVRAFDQSGMVPHQAAVGSPLRLTLPEDVMEAARALAEGEDTPPGIDAVNASLVGPRRVFPIGHFGGGDSQSEQSEPAFGELVATHGRWPAVINVNTAPATLLEEAFRAAGRGGLEAVLAKRAEGKPATVPPAENEQRRRSTARTTGVNLAAESTVWSFRIDVHAGAVRRSWWCVYELGSKGWRCVQRVVIPD